MVWSKSHIFVQILIKQFLMKKFVVMSMLLCSLVGWAQQKPKTWSITPKIGLNVSKPTKEPPFYVIVAINKKLDGKPTLHDGTSFSSHVFGTTATVNKSGLVGGVEVQYQFNSRLGISLGAYYSQQGVRYDNVPLGDVPLPGGGEERLKLGVAKQLSVETSYISLPILLNCYVYKGLALKAGVQPAYNVKDKARCDVDIESKEGYLTAAVAGTAKVHKVDAAVPLGLSYDFPNGLVVDMRYLLGVVNLYSKGGEKGQMPASRTSVFQLTVGYKFGL